MRRMEKTNGVSAGIKAVGFDVGHTLIHYRNPLNWQGLYRAGLEQAAEAAEITLSEDMILAAKEILLQYNTRVNYREWEVSSDQIFSEIIREWGLQADLSAVKTGFYSFFRTDAVPYPEVGDTLRELKRRGIKTGILTDVAYGMDNVFSLQDIAPVADWIDVAYTSVDVGFRKPNPAGYRKLLDFFEISPGEMIFVGDEEKDIAGAKRLGMVSVLINRSKEIKNFGQDYTLDSLSGLFTIEGLS